MAIVVIPHDVNPIDAAIRDVIHAAGNLKAKSLRHRPSPDQESRLQISRHPPVKFLVSFSNEISSH